MAQDALMLLDTDHQRVEVMFRDYQKAGADRAQKTDLAQIICMELTVHATLEEELFYPAVEKATGDRNLVEQARREHQEAKDLIARIGAEADPDALMLQLQRAVEQHVAEERQQIFPRARSALINLEKLGAQLEERRNELLATLVPTV